MTLKRYRLSKTFTRVALQKQKAVQICIEKEYLNEQTFKLQSFPSWYLLKSSKDVKTCGREVLPCITFNWNDKSCHDIISPNRNLIGKKNPSLPHLQGCSAPTPQQRGTQCIFTYYLFQDIKALKELKQEGMKYDGAMTRKKHISELREMDFHNFFPSFYL